MISFRLPFAPLTANKQARGRVHWTTIRRENEKLRLGVLLQAGPGPWRGFHRAVSERTAVPDRKETPPGRKMHLDITVGRKRLQDPDNLLASLKGLIDAIKRAGWLWDDSAKWLNLTARERRSPHEFTEITLEEVR